MIQAPSAIHLTVVPPSGKRWPWQHYLQGLWLSGLRLGESLELHWDRDDRLCVDMAGKHPLLQIPGELQKNGQDQLLPITPDFAEFLLETPRDERRGRVFKLSGRCEDGKGLDDQYVSAVIVAIGEAAGIKVYTHPKTGKVKYASAHDLRRSCGTRWAPRVMPTVFQQLMRHTDIQTTLRYYVNQSVSETAALLWREFGQSPENASGLGQAAKKSTVSGTRDGSSPETDMAAENVTAYPASGYDELPG